MDLNWCMMKKVKGYLVWGLVFYTVLVTYFLVLTAWSDDVTGGGSQTTKTKGHGQDDKLINVLYQEERRHLRSFKDVVKTYGGMVGLKFSQDANGNSGGETIENGRGPNNADDSNSPDPNNENSNSSTGYVYTERQGKDNIAADKPKFTVEVESWEEAVMGKTRRFGNATDAESSDQNNNGDNRKNDGSLKNIPHNGNIFIEDSLSSAIDNSTGDAHNNQVVIKNGKNTMSRNKNDRKLGMSSKVDNDDNNKNVKKKVSTGGSFTEYCDKIDYENPDLCLTERVTHSHPSHVNITTNHMSFKPIGDLFIYSAFLDTRRKPASIRFMVIAPKSRGGVKRSGYWCAYNLPSVLSQKFYWNGIKEPASARPDQATPLDYYAASDGHEKKLQFYVMSCAVPAKHLPTLQQFDTNRIHVVAGSKESPLLETVQERIAVDVVNNQGLPWHEMIKRSAVLGEVFQITPIKNNSKSYNSSGLWNTAYKSNVNNNLINTLTPNDNENNTSDIRKNEKINLNKFDNISNSAVGNNLRSSTLSGNSHPNTIVSCIAPIFATVSLIQIVEFIELTLLLGSQHIVLYTSHLSDDVKDVLAMYRYQGLVTVLPWPIPSPASIWANGRDIALNDCLYRSMHRYEFALFHDMDEFFVPRNTPDIPSFINFLYLKAGMKRNRTSDIIFSSAYFSPPTKAQTQSLTSISGYTKDVSKFASLRSVHRTYFNPGHSLRMIRPVLAYRVGGGERKRTVFTISAKYAAVNHYSKCVGTTSISSGMSKTGEGLPVPSNMKNSTKTTTDVDCNATKLDMRMWKIKDKLIRQTKDSIRLLNSKQKLEEL